MKHFKLLTLCGLTIIYGICTSCCSTDTKTMIDGGDYKFWQEKDSLSNYHKFSADGKYETYNRTDSLINDPDTVTDTNRFHTKVTFKKIEMRPERSYWRLIGEDSIDIGGCKYEIFEVSKDTLVLQHADTQRHKVYVDSLVAVPDYELPTRFLKSPNGKQQ